jgi:hypothetical protein
MTRTKLNEVRQVLRAALALAKNDEASNLGTIAFFSDALASISDFNDATIEPASQALEKLAAWHLKTLARTGDVSKRAEEHLFQFAFRAWKICCSAEHANLATKVGYKVSYEFDEEAETVQIVFTGHDRKHAYDYVDQGVVMSLLRQTPVYAKIKANLAYTLVNTGADARRQLH